MTDNPKRDGPPRLGNLTELLLDALVGGVGAAPEKEVDEELADGVAHCRLFVEGLSECQTHLKMTPL